MIRPIVLAAALAVTAATPACIPALAQPACDPFTTTPSYLHEAPTAEETLGFALGSQEVSVGQSNDYLDAVATASDRVIAGTAATSVQDRPLRYAVVGREDRMTPTALATIRANAQALRDPTLAAAQTQALEAATPEILWISANVHGDEERGVDAALQVLHELADRASGVRRRLPGGALGDARAQRRLREGAQAAPTGANRARPQLLPARRSLPCVRAPAAGASPAADGRRRVPARRAAHVPGLHPYASPAGTTTLPVGTYWIPLAQGQKHGSRRC